MTSDLIKPRWNNVEPFDRAFKTLPVCTNPSLIATKFAQNRRRNDTYMRPSTGGRVSRQYELMFWHANKNSAAIVLWVIYMYLWTNLLVLSFIFHCWLSGGCNSHRLQDTNWMHKRFGASVKVAWINLKMARFGGSDELSLSACNVQCYTAESPAESMVFVAFLMLWI